MSYFTYRHGIFIIGSNKESFIEVKVDRSLLHKNFGSDGTPDGDRRACSENSTVLSEIAMGAAWRGMRTVTITCADF